MNRVIWNTLNENPRDMLGKSIINGRESLYRNRQMECCRVGTDCVQHVTLTRHIIPVRGR